MAETEVTRRQATFTADDFKPTLDGLVEELASVLGAAKTVREEARQLDTQLDELKEREQELRDAIFGMLDARVKVHADVYTGWT